MKFDELYKSLTEAYPMAPNPNVTKQQPGQPNQAQPNQQQTNQQPNQQQTQQTNQQQGGVDQTVLDELAKAQNPEAVLQILQQKLGVK
jgi:hypothetical protein